MYYIINYIYIVHYYSAQSMEVTDKAFHENWYQFNIPIKRTFMLVIIASNLELKLSTFEKFNLSLPSFMAVRYLYFSIELTYY